MNRSVVRRNTTRIPLMILEDNLTWVKGTSPQRDALKQNVDLTNDNLKWLEEKGDTLSFTINNLMMHYRELEKQGMTLDIHPV